MGERVRLKGPGEDLGVRAKRMLEVTEEDEARVREINRTAKIRRAPRARILVDRFVKGIFG
jgi:hypothetical protein